MLDNHLYNLMLQLTQENKALWRIQNHYTKDASNCMSCQKFWKKMKIDKEEHIKDLTQLLKDHLS